MSAVALSSPAAPTGRVWRLPGPLGLRAYRRTKSAAAAQAAEDFERLLGDLRPDDICLDLGAHYGTVTTRMAATGAQVHAVEPDPNNFARLTAATVGLPNVTCHEAAIGLAETPLTLRRARNYDKRPEGRSMGSSVVRSSPFAMDRGAGFEVRQIDLMAFIAALPQRPRIIKMDVEGAEWPILDALLTQGEPAFGALFVETHERFNSWRYMPKLGRLHDSVAARGDRYVNLYWH